MSLYEQILEKLAAKSPAWQRSAGKNPEGGLNAKGRASYKRETGGTLKAPVTESNPKGERAKRQNSFCSRMCGMKRVNTGAKLKAIQIAVLINHCVNGTVSVVKVTIHCMKRWRVRYLENNL